MCFATAHFHFWSPDRSVAYSLQLQAEEVFKFPYVRTHLDAKVGPGQRRRPGLGGVAGLGGPRSFLFVFRIRLQPYTIYFHIYNDNPANPWNVASFPSFMYFKHLFFAPLARVVPGCSTYVYICLHFILIIYVITRIMVLIFY